MIKTKVICTLGPAVDDEATTRRLIASGIDVARMNFSHGTHEEHAKRLTQFRALCDEMNMHIPVLLDTKGPEIRLGVFKGDGIDLVQGQNYILTTEDLPCDEERASISYLGLPQDVSPGDKILIDDGLVCLEVRSVSGHEILCNALNGGHISSRKSINVPDVSLRLPSLTEQDKADILFAAQHDYDFIAVSFVRKREDILEIEHFLDENGGRNIKLIAKIESREGLNNLDEIIRVSDGLMVARGDLGVEIPVEEIPIVQKDMIKRCYRAGKPVITATQMLDSMIRNPRPTRAEVTDVANAIFDGTSAIMLSGETAAGKYPIESLQTMKRITKTAEDAIDYWQRFRAMETRASSSITNAISHATCMSAMDLSAAAIVAVTTSGSTARKVSSYRPACPIIAATTDKKIYRQLHLSWGVTPILVDVVSSTDDLIQVAMDAAKKSGLVKDGDLIVLTAGVPVGMSGTTNMIKVEMIGNILVRGTGIGDKKASGPLELIRHSDAGNQTYARGSVLVTDEISDKILPFIRLSSAVILDGEDKDGRAATLSKALEIPVVIKARGAMSLLRSGTMVSVDAKEGIVKYIER